MRRIAPACQEARVHFLDYKAANRGQRRWAACRSETVLSIR